MTQLTSLGPDCPERRPRRTSSASVRRLSLLVAALLAVLGTGCSVVELTKGRPTVDTSSLAPGVSRAELEARLGAPEWSWVSGDGVRYSLYAFDTGVLPNPVEAYRALIFDMYYLGLPELLGMFMYNADTFRVLVSYDANDVVLGLFDGHETPPTDGRSDRRPKAFCWNRIPEECRYK